jgi:hypothetical protein
MNALEPGTVLYAETARPYPVAHADESGTLWLDFGQHAGTPLHEVPDRYLRWMVQAGKVFLPEDLIEPATCPQSATTCACWRTSLRPCSMNVQSEPRGACLLSRGRALHADAVSQATRGGASDG